ncbi:hypothetical protein A9179_00125 [Pseudomonas alcaligenes]|uniref:Uncharacterized protein n=1 Tax=Aquipseudomonas alcaligenes TaxID=43263 RepID=A0ABR7RVH5_AQUAC|nr:hypothetical protein [Pseudomonas alcaligenes]
MFLHGELPQLARLSADISEAGLEITDVESWRLYLAGCALGFQRGRSPAPGVDQPTACRWQPRAALVAGGSLPLAWRTGVLAARSFHVKPLLALRLRAVVASQERAD